MTTHSEHLAKDINKVRRRATPHDSIELTIGGHSVVMSHLTFEFSSMNLQAAERCGEEGTQQGIGSCLPRSAFVFDAV
jgi:hypothetical protein